MKLALIRVDGSTKVSRVLGNQHFPTPWNSFAEALTCDDITGTIAQFGHTAPLDPEKILAPLCDRAQIIGVGANYADHGAEGGVASTLPEPVFFAMLWGAVVGPGDPIVVPEPKAKIDYEAELAVVIGKQMSRIVSDQALRYVFGYTVANDVSAREVMERERMQVMLSKSGDSHLPVGPVLVTADEIQDPQDLRIRTRVNGELRQDSTTGRMSVSVAHLLSTLSQSVTLHAGDVVVTGTPSGVGMHMHPRTFLKDGDIVDVSIERIGVLRNPVVARMST